MGAWAEDSFGNDTACDWVWSFLEDPGLPKVRNAIQTVLDAEEEVDADEACECLAACEVVARLQGNWGLRNAYSEELDKWVEANPNHIPEDLRTSANAAIERILAPNSELQELWGEEGHNDEWHSAMDDLRQRIMKRDNLTPSV